MEHLMEYGSASDDDQPQTTTATTTPVSGSKRKIKHVTKWKCDGCKVAFPTHEEASEHEVGCGKQQQQIQEARKRPEQLKPNPSHMCTPFDARKLRKKYNVIDGEIANTWDAATDDIAETKVVAYSKVMVQSDLVAKGRDKGEGKAIGKAAQAFTVKTDKKGNYCGYLMGNLSLPPGGIKDAESVGPCAQTFTVCLGQPQALEVAYNDPHHCDSDNPNPFNSETAQRFLLGPGDVFHVTAGNCYRLENHSKEYDCLLTWTIIKPNPKPGHDPYNESPEEIPEPQPTKNQAKVMEKSKIKPTKNQAKVMEKSREVWLKNFQKIKEFYEENGHLTLPATYSPEYAHLSKWLSFQRFRSTSTLQKDQLELLESINYKTTPKHRKGNDTQWEVKYNQLKQVHDETGGDKVKIKEQALVCWFSSQKNLLRMGKLEPLREEKLRMLGIDLTCHRRKVVESKKNEEKWQSQFEKLKEYRLCKGDCNVPTHSKDNSLGVWVYKQRIRYAEAKTGHAHMNPDRIQKLEQLGFVWSVNKKKGIRNRGSQI